MKQQSGGGSGRAALRGTAVLLVVCGTLPALAGVAFAGPDEQEPGVIANAATDATGDANEMVSLAVQASGSSGGADVLVAFGRLPKYEVFELRDPARIVLDLANTDATKVAGDQAVSVESVHSVRVFQYNQDGNTLARMEIELDAPTAYEISEQGNYLVLHLGAGSPAIAVVPEPASSEVAQAAATESPAAAPSQDEALLASAVNPAAPTAEEPVDAALLEAADSRESGADVRTYSADDPEIRKLLEETPMLAQATGARTSNITGSPSAAAPAKQYTGERINFDLKDLDIIDFLREIAQISGFNISVDPGVSGKVTLYMVDVPWDQVLEIALKNNNLEKVIEGNVMRVATVEKLKREEEERLQLEEAKRLGVPLETKIFYLSYSKPNEMSGILLKQLSKRGELIVDRRTNSLIIADIPDRMRKIEQLVDELDVRTRQVVIQAQIVRTTKLFSRSLGISWNQSFTMDAEHGNTSGYRFPNAFNEGSGFSWDGSADGATTPPPGSLVQFGMSDILNTFRLQVALQAAEIEGVAKSLSNPRISTSDNATAMITSGKEIAYQVITRDGPKTEFKQASITLAVTPHITNDNFISLDARVTKDSPDFSVDPPAINTNQAQTDVLIRDGETLVIGGLNQSVEDTAYNKVPWIANVPVLGWLFKGKRVQNNFDDLLVFITPHIMESEAVSLQPTVLN
ncbi:MAG: type IV pilus secretin PilQ [Candidatus Schekmanbacteria bacterium]|nr:type IV pilus secretin PilQ [Candidatus Schekmanbacteria bacterium]